MNVRRGMAFGSLAVLGLAVAIALGLLANAIAGDSIGLSAKPLRAGDRLAPAAAGRSSGDRRQHGSGPDRGRTHDRDEVAPPASSPTTTTEPTTAVEPGDDHGGAGVDNSGSGSLNSGSGNSGSSGSSGSDDD